MMLDYQEIFGQRLRRAMDVRKVSVQDLSRMSMVPERTLYHYKAGEKPPTYQNLVSIGNADMIPERVAYTQLAEECTELAHAALKLGRFADEQQAFTMGEADRARWIGNIYEEIADVLVCMDAVKMFLPFGAESMIEDIRKYKNERWQERLKGGKG